MIGTMLKALSAPVFAFGLIACTQTVEAPAPPLTTQFPLATVEQGAAALSADDEFMAAVSAADIAIRVRRAGATKEELRAVYASAPRPWTEAERVRLNTMLTRHGGELDQLARWLPPSVLLIKSDGAADTQLPHTRGAAINMGVALPDEDATLDGLFFHELFHVLSRHNGARRDEMYAIVGFERCEIALPAALQARTITNPDAPLVRHAAPLSTPGRLVAPVLFAEPPVFDPAHPDFDHYFQLRFLVADRTADGGCALEIADGEPVALPGAEAVAAIHAVAGRNTNYVLHPEELLADNFSQLMMRRADAPDPQVQARLAGFLGLSLN